MLDDTEIRLCLINVMPGPATDLATRTLRELNPTFFGLCYDSSHDQIDGPRPFDLIDDFRNRIFAVHLSDRSDRNRAAPPTPLPWVRKWRFQLRQGYVGQVG